MEATITAEAVECSAHTAAKEGTAVAILLAAGIASVLAML